MTYLPCDELMILTTYYNPCKYQSRRRLTDAFISSLAGARLHYLVIECSFDGGFDFSDGPNMLRVNAESILWQRDRLLNLGLRTLPDRYKYVAWVDSDVEFTQLDWTVESVRRLQHHALVQPFDSVVFMKPDGNPSGHIEHSFVRQSVQDRRNVWSQFWGVHGHTGMAWVARRELLDRHGLYDVAVCGVSDHLMAQAMFGLNEAYIGKLVHGSSSMLSHFLSWAAPFFADVDSRVSYVPGIVKHHWHGALSDRRYNDRGTIYTELGYDPYSDVTYGPIGPLEWSVAALRDKQDLVSYVRDYFMSRKEDG